MLQRSPHPGGLCRWRVRGLTSPATGALGRVVTGNGEVRSSAWGRWFSSPGSPGTSGACSRAGSPPTRPSIAWSGVDVIPPAHDVGDVEFVRADIRNPMIGRVIESVGRRHGRAHERHRHAHLRRGTHPAEGDQRHRHDAAAGGLPEVEHRAPPRREVLRRGLRLHPARPGDVHRGHERQAHAVRRVRQGLDRGRGVRARLRPSPPRHRHPHPALREHHRAADPHLDHRLLQPAGHPGAARLRRPDAVHARGRRHRRARARRRPAPPPGSSTSPATAW